jgi:hypothetical protein
MVGLGILYGFVYAAWAANTGGLLKNVAHGIALVWCFQFIFLGNEMYYSQHLVNNAEMATVNRVVARIDSVAAKNGMPYPLQVKFLGRYSPSGKIFPKFNTLGHSPLDWDAGNIYRQATVFRNLGIDGIQINTDSQLRDAIKLHVSANETPIWPHPDSVFIYSGNLIIVNFGE